MKTRLAGIALVVMVTLTASPLWAANFSTRNFVVTAPTAQLAREFGQWAEYYRKLKAEEWLGQEMPPWSRPCPLRIKVTRNGAGGATTFHFGNGQVYQSMEIEGSLDRLRDSVLPHEVTHTVFAHYFRQPVPRWADEGGSVLSEDRIERARHDRMCRQLLNAGRGMQLRVLFSLKQYPRDVMVLYAQGYSVSRYLVDKGGRPKFLAFLAQGMREGWDRATQTQYGYSSVKHLEQDWLDFLRSEDSLQVHQRDPVGTRGPGTEASETTVASRNAPIVMRDFTPPAQPTLYAPVLARGASPDPTTETGPRTGGSTGWNQSPRRVQVNGRAAPAVQLFPPEPLPPGPGGR